MVKFRDEEFELTSLAYDKFELWYARKNSHSQLNLLEAIYLSSHSYYMKEKDWHPRVDHSEIIDLSNQLLNCLKWITLHYPDKAESSETD